MEKIKEGFRRTTEIISPFSGIEFVPEEYLIPACERGTKVHKHIESKLKLFDTKCEDEEISGYLESFDKFWDESKEQFRDAKIHIEKRLYCDELKITGQIDLIIESWDKTLLIDWKTGSNANRRTYALQGAAYRYLCEVNEFTNVDNALFVKLNKKGKGPTLHKFDNYEEDFEIFHKCLELYDYFQMDKTRKNWRR